MRLQAGGEPSLDAGGARAAILAGGTHHARRDNGRAGGSAWTRALSRPLSRAVCTRWAPETALDARRAVCGACVYGICVFVA